MARHWHQCAVLVLIRNIGHWTLPKIWLGTFLVLNVQPRGKTKLIQMEKMVTKHPMVGQFGSEFPAICNCCGGMVA